MGETAEEFVASVMMDNRLGDHRAEARHPLAKPCRDPAIVKRKIGVPGSVSHEASGERLRNTFVSPGALVVTSGRRRVCRASNRRVMMRVRIAMRAPAAPGNLSASRMRHLAPATLTGFGGA